MRKRYTNHLILLLFFNLIGSGLFAQIDPCITYMKDANQKYEEGWFDQSIEKVKKSLDECDLTNNEKIVDYKLLILNYIAIDNIEEAELAAAAIMKIDPNYEADKLHDSEEIIILFQKYRPTPFAKLLFYTGTNLSNVKASQTYGLNANSSENELSNYKSRTGLQFGLGFEYKAFKLIWLQTGIQYRRVSYSNQLMNIQNRTITYKEDIDYLDIPILAKYYYGQKKLQLFAQAGISASFLNSALGELSRDNVSDIVDRKKERNAVYLGYGIGTGISYRLNNLSLQAGVNYLNTPLNLNKAGTRYDNLDMVFKYHYLDHDFTLDNLQINLGVSYTIGYKNAITKTGDK